LVQFWTPVSDANRVISTNLRMMVARDSSLPEQIIVNEQVMQVARRFSYEQRFIPSQPVETLFPPHRATMLKRYNLSFCSGNFIDSDVLLPPPNNQFSSAKEPTLFALTILLFLAQSAHRDLMPTIRAVLKQSIELATNRGLLLQSPSVPITPPVTFTAQKMLPPFSALIPRLKENGNAMLTSNPFSRALVISDKHARRLHAAIDSSKSVAELSRSTGMDMKDTSAALQVLLKLQRIELLNDEGQVMKPTLFFPESDL